MLLEQTRETLSLRNCELKHYLDLAIAEDPNVRRIGCGEKSFQGFALPGLTKEERLGLFSKWNTSPRPYRITFAAMTESRRNSPIDTARVRCSRMPHNSVLRLAIKRLPRRAK